MSDIEIIDPSGNPLNYDYDYWGCDEVYACNYYNPYATNDEGCLFPCSNPDGCNENPGEENIIFDYF